MLSLLTGSLLPSAAAIIGGADGPTAIFIADNSQSLRHALTLAWQGMTGIFIVMIVISLIVFALSKFTSK